MNGQFKMNNLKSILLGVLFIGILIISVLIFRTNSVKKNLKKDLIELANIKYGLFNVDEWKVIIADVLTKKIEDFEITGENREEIRLKISTLISEMTDDLESEYNQHNSEGFGGFLRRKGAKIFGIFDEIKKDTDVFTDNIMAFIDDPSNKLAVKNYLIESLNQIFDNTFAKIDYTLHNEIIAAHNKSNRAETIDYLSSRISIINNTSANYKYIIILLSFFIAIILYFIKPLIKLDFLLITASLLLLLIVGISLPMIEIDARVSNISIDLMGTQVNFYNQVLYYKSKSIIEVIKLMFIQGGFDLLLVGFFIFVFSVLFPISKLIASVLLTFKTSLKSNKIISFLVHKTGKWSMADVMVVAIFMAYIGFSGILKEQLGHVENMSKKIEVLTTNESSLQTGFYAFTAFAILSLLTTSKLKTFIKQ